MEKRGKQNAARDDALSALRGAVCLEIVSAAQKQALDRLLNSAAY